MTNNQKNLLKTIESFTKDIEKINTFISSNDNNNRIKNHFDTVLIRQKIEKEQDRKHRILDYLQNFHKLFIETPIEDRKELIDSRYAKIEMKKSEAIINGDGFSVNEYNQIQEYAILVFEPLINAIDYVPSMSKKIKSENDSKVNSFNLKSNVPFQLLNEIRNDFIVCGLISKSTTVEEFRSVFTHNLETTRVSWVKKGFLWYFVQELVKVENAFIEPVKNYWKITANCFTINGEKIDSNKFRLDKPTQLKKAIECIDKAIVKIVSTL